MAVLHVKTPNGATKAYDLDNMGGIPVGFERFSMNPNIPQGWLPLLGGLYDRATYPDLWAWVETQSGYCITEAEWQNLSDSQNGNVPFYSHGNGTTTFRVPSLKCWIKGKDGSETIGTYKEAGLPNITGDVDDNYGGPNSIATNDALQISYGSATNAQGSDGSFKYGHIILNASLSNPIYGNATTVVPESIVGMWLVKAYGMIEDTGSINEQQYIDDRYNAIKTYVDNLDYRVVSKNIGKKLNGGGEQCSYGYIRYDNGLQICWDNFVSIKADIAGHGTLTYWGYTPVTYPAPFIANPHVSVNIYDRADFWNAVANSVSTTGFSFIIAGNEIISHDGGYFAIGSWK